VTKGSRDVITSITRTTVDNVNWTPIVAQSDCDYVAFYAESGVAVKVRSDSSDPATEKQLGASLQETLATTPPRFNRETRFFAGDNVYFVKTNAGTDVIVATWSGIRN